MGKVTFEELVQFLESDVQVEVIGDNYTSRIDDFLNDFKRNGWVGGGVSVKTEKYGNVYFYMEESVGGGEGGGEDVVRVMRVELKDAGGDKFYIKTTGSYYSYDGITWDYNFIQVYPKLITVTSFFED